MKSLICFILILSINSINAFGTDRIAFLTSIPNTKGKSFLGMGRKYKVYHTDKIAANIFKKYTKSMNRQYKIDIIHGADAYHLHKILTDSRYVGIIWVSHAGFYKFTSGKSKKSKEMNGLSLENKIIDISGNNIAPIFQQINPSLKFLGVISCGAKKILDDLIQNNTHFSELKNINLYASSQKITIKEGIKRSVYRLKKALKNNAPNRYNDKEVKEGVHIKLKRSIPLKTNTNKLFPLMVFAGEQLLTVLPKGKRGEIQSHRLFIPIEDEENLQRNNFKIIIDSGANGLDQRNISFGKFRIKYIKYHSYPLEKPKWELFTRKNGTPIGKTFQIFKYSGEI